MGNTYHFGKWRPCPGIGHVKNSSSAFGDCLVNLPGFRIANPGAGVSVGQSYFDNARAGGADRMIVEISLAAHHNDFIIHTFCIRQPPHAAGVKPGHACSGGQQQAS